MTLTEFLLARIAEDEAVARAAGDGDDEWEYGEHCGAMQVQTVAVNGTLGYEQHLAITRDYEGLSDSVDEDAGPHIARWDPARVLAECAAKRAIIDACVGAGFRVQRDDVLCLLAHPYAEHPDYVAAIRDLRR